MSSFVRQLVLLALSALLSWWLFLGLPVEATSVPEPRVEVAGELTLDLTPRLEEPALARVAGESPSEPQPETTSAPDPVETVERDARPPELGSPEGEADEHPADLAEEDDDDAEKPSLDASTADAFRADAELLEAAAAEFSGEKPRGFRTILVASPADQLDIARAFGEEIVLVPRSALDPEEESPETFRLAHDDSVELVKGRPDLTSYRQYRDLFDYEYARLPEPVRALRRSILARSEVYLFAALIPLEEWAVVIGRRREALAESGRELSDVVSFKLKYVRSSNRGFDLRVDEIRFTNGERFRPANMERKGG